MIINHSIIDLSQIVMCTNHRPDFNAEEVASVEKDRRYIKLYQGILSDTQ